MNKYEQLIEYIINEQEEQARELFHQIVVEKSREIYENLIDENDFDESFRPGDQVEDLAQDISDDATLPEAEEDEMGDMGDDMMSDMGDEEDMGDDMGMDDMGGDDMGGEEGLEDRVMDLEDALDELKAEFDKLMSDEEGEEEHGGDDSDADADEEPAGEEEPEEKMISEYAHKVGNDWDKNGNQGEGKAVGARADSVTGATNTRTPVAGKNDMGGSAANIAKGGAESAPDGQRPTGKAGGFLKNPQEIDVAKRNVNVPGGNKGAQNYFSKKETSYEKAHGAEGQTTDGKLPVNPKALQGGKVR